MRFDLESIEKYYKEAPTLELLELVSKPSVLRKEVIPLLQRELINRNEQEQALRLSEFLVEEKAHVNLDTPDQIDAYIQQGLNEGVTMENIRLDLRERGVTSFGILDQGNEKQQMVMDYITTLKEQGATENQIKEKLETNLEINPEEIEVLQSKLHRKGTMNLVIGYSLVVLLGGIGLISLSIGRGISIPSMILIGVGVWRITEGYKQRK